jgi:hypothetical protein
MQIFLPNLHFDDSQAGRVVRHHPALDQVIGALAPLMGLLANEGDIVLVRDGYEPTGLPECLNHVQWIVAMEANGLSTDSTLVPWGWDDHARQFARNLNSSSVIPSDDAVRQVNQRSFLAGRDVVDPNTISLPFGETFGRLCTDEASVTEALQQLDSAGVGSWILKAEWTASGRNRLRGRGTSLNPQQRNWARKQLNSCGAVYLEPQVHVVRECSVQFDVFDGARLNEGYSVLRGVVELVTDSNGRYIGSIISENWDTLWQPAIDHGHRIAAEAASLGYFGPLGIDCMLLELPGGSQVLRMSHDINGRHTMGRLALSLLPRLQDGQAGFWSHSAPSDLEEDDRSAGILPTASPVDIVDSMSTSPKRVGGQPPSVLTQFIVTSTLPHARMLAAFTKKHHQDKI